MTNMNNSINDLISYINKSVSPYHVVEEGKLFLEAAGFKPLSNKGEWELKEGERYYCTPYGTCLFAFTIGSMAETDVRLHIAAAHTDWPCLHLKPESLQKGNGYLRLDTEVYGGPILNTWMDRPLSLAGALTLKSKDIYHPEVRLTDAKRAIATIPNLAIHYNRDVNKGVELKKQTDMLPLIGLDTGNQEDDLGFLNVLVDNAECRKDDILDADIYVYNTDKPEFIGVKEDMLSAPRLDNLTSCYALLQGIAKAGTKGINLIALYDHEEIGSRTKQGADSSLLSRMLEKIYHSLGKDRIALYDSFEDSMLLSVDVAHALHPAKPEKYDRANSTCLGEGVTLKLSSNQRYTYDSTAVAILQQLCEQHSIKYKKFVNHSDAVGGTTLGPMISSWLPIKTVDLGVPILAMHSARELMNINDQLALEKLIEEFMKF